MSRIRIFVLVVLALALATAFTACGGGGGGGSDDAQQVIDDATFKGVESGTIDLTVSVDLTGDQPGNLKASLSGPFQSGGKDNLPQLDLTVKAKGNTDNEAVDFEGGLTLLSDRAFVEYKGVEYEVDPTTFGFVKSGFEQAEQESEKGAGATACQKAAEGLKVDEFVDNLKSEGGAEVDGTDTTKISGDLNIEGALDAIVKLIEDPACSSQLDAAGPVSASDIESVRGEILDAVKRAHADVYVGDDNIIRRVAAGFTAEEGSESVEINFDFTLSNVNEDQDIKAPSGAKPLEDLFQELGVNPLELLEGGSGGGTDLGGLLEGLSGGSSGSSDEGLDESQAYLECLQGVETPADLQKCANLAN